MPDCRSPMPLPAFSETAAGIARYLAESIPVMATGRLLSLEQAPTEGLRN